MGLWSYEGEIGKVRCYSTIACDKGGTERRRVRSYQEVGQDTLAGSAAATIFPECLRSMPHRIDLQVGNFDRQVFNVPHHVIGIVEAGSNFCNNDQVAYDRLAA